ncbi:hypothetical protein [Laspinema olomoucense]|uniref:Transposase n=1 Tax=Laspinema olomoucense D3b TaxID=2953688 RepID=A0ABT2N7V6_9CYAN|nr:MULTISPECIES: hypothetical protein [unclassified Laspinema]MCT7973121.1 hypothetical protein [Laspinema sp. D3d]MCT7977820.1 hypothetical protein [Laspinema sp. D3b]MCT7990593.1 hypothetical protein [Laspinema sp. D3a]
MNRVSASEEIGINDCWSQFGPLLKGITLKLMEARQRGRLIGDRFSRAATILSPGRIKKHDAYLYWNF